MPEVLALSELNPNAVLVLTAAVLGPRPTVIPFTIASTLKVFMPAIVWAVVKSTNLLEDAAEVTNSVVASLVELSAANCVIPVVPVGKTGIPVKVGESDRTTSPVPVIALETKPLLGSVNTACEAVKDESIG